MNTILLNSPLFRGLSIVELDTILKKINHQVRNFKKGELLAQAGEKVEKAMILIDGRLQGEMVDFAGNTLKIEELDSLQMVAAAFLFGYKTHFPVNLLAKTDGKMLVILKKDFIAMLHMESIIMINYLNILSGKAQFLTNKITFLSLKTIREKIAFYLLQHLKSGNLNILKIEQTQTSLADLFGVTRPSLSRSILELESQEILSWSRDQVVIKDYKKLNKILGK